MTAPYQQNQAKERGKAIPTRGVLNLNSSNKQLMRIIKFRGKRLDNGAWETGGFVELLGSDMPHNHYVIDKRTGHHTPVIPETVGQFTGLLDKNGTEIYEGDIIRHHDFSNVYKPDFDGEVIFIKSGFRIKFKSEYDKSGFMYWNLCFDDFANRKIEVIGNIHDNPELIKTK